MIDILMLVKAAIIRVLRREAVCASFLLPLEELEEVGELSLSHWWHLFSERSRA